MNSASKQAVAALLVFSIAGCTPKNVTTATPPANAQAPAVATGKAGALYPPPLTESQTQTETAPPPPVVAAKTEPEPVPPPPPPVTHKSTSHKPKPSAAKSDAPATSTAAPTSTNPETPASSAPSPSTAPTETTSEVAATGEPTSSSPIGELTTGNTQGQAQKGKETGDIINSTENGLNAIKRPLSNQEQETVNQIKAFLTKAKTAMTNQDLDGAYILATKAKVLFDELNKT